MGRRASFHQTGGKTQVSSLLLLLCLAFVGSSLPNGCSSSDMDSSSGNPQPGPETSMAFSASDFQYVCQGQQIDLDLYAKKIAVRAQDEAPLRAWLEAEPLVREPLLLEKIGRGITLVSVKPSATEEELLDLVLRLNQSGLAAYASPMFQVPSCRIVVTDEIVVKFREGIPQNEIDEFAQAKNLRILKADYPTERCCLLGFTSQAGANPLAVSREIVLCGEVEYAHPNFLEIHEPPDARSTAAEEEDLVSDLFVSEQNATILYPNLFQEFDWIVAGHRMFSAWSRVLTENFEGPEPLPGWTNEDRDPADGRYAWGRVSDVEYPSLMGPYYQPEGNKGWVAAIHDPTSPDRQPDMDDASEGYAPDMDTWLIYKVDLSHSLWARVRFQGSFYAPSTETFGWFVSLDGENWHGSEMAGVGEESKLYYWRPRFPDDPSDMGVYLDLTHTEGLGDLTGQKDVYVGFRFRSDATATPRVSPDDFSFYGVFLDNIVIEECLALDVPGITSDPLSNRQWGLKNMGQSGGTAGYDVNIRPAWDFLGRIPWARQPSDPDSPVTVAVLDEGVDLQHEDLRLVAGYDATYDPELDPDHPDSQGGPNPWDGHGTACAGIVGARENGLGVVGVAPGVKIMPVRIAYSERGATVWTTTKAQIADGILWAAQHGAKILSNSWGGGLRSDLEDDAIRQARQMGSLLVFAAGNDNHHSGPLYPASEEDTIAVGAMSPCGERKSPSSCDGEWWWGSTHGIRQEGNRQTAVEVMAPGVLIATTDITGDGGYVPTNTLAGKDGNYVVSFNGTSSACPFVSGVLALMYSAAPALDPEDARAILHSTARDIGQEGWDPETGYGLVNAPAAVLRAAALSGDLRIVDYELPEAVIPGSRSPLALTILNYSPFPSEPFYVQVYLSRDGTLDGSDRFLWYGSPGSMGPEAQEALTASVPVPADVPAGSYSLIVLVDSLDQVPEVDETNNLLVHPMLVVHPPDLVVKPSAVDFGLVRVGEAQEATIWIQNEGEEPMAPLTVTGITLAGSPAFQNPWNLIPSTPFELGPNQSTQIWLYFAPSSAGVFEGTLSIQSNDPDRPFLVVPLSGSAVQPTPLLALEHVPVDFGAVATSRFFRVRNQGDGDLSWSLDTSTQPGWLTRIEPTAGTTRPGAYTDVILTASRNMLTPGTYNWTLPVSSNGGDATVAISLTVPGQTLSVSPQTLDFGEEETSKTIEIANIGTFGLRWTIDPDLPDWLEADAMSGGIDPGESVQVHLTVDRSGLAPGTYQHTVQIGSNGGSAAVQVSMTVPSAAPLEVTAWADPTSGPVPLEVAFFAEATGGKPPYSFSWTFGDEGWSAEQNPEHVYTWPSEFRATVWVFDEEGNSASDEVVVTVVGAPE